MNASTDQPLEIRAATSEDLSTVLEWLRLDEEGGDDASFWCNRRVIARAHEAGQMTVLRLPELGPVAFEIGGLRENGILAVRRSYRRQGLGRLLAESCIRSARQDKVNLLFVECSPWSSIPFWRSMGFAIKEDSNQGFMELRIQHELPAGGDAVQVRVVFSTGYERSNPRAFAADGRRYAEGKVCLAERIVCWPRLPDVFATVVIDGFPIFDDEAKLGGTVGIEVQDFSYFIDELRIPTPAA